MAGRDIRVGEGWKDEEEQGIVSAVGEDGFAAGAFQGVDGGEGSEVFAAGCGVIGEQEDTLAAGPELAERGFVFKDVGRIRPEAAVPQSIDVAVDEVDLLTGVEEQRGAGGEFAVEDDEVAGLLGGGDGEREVFRAEDGIEADEAFVRGEQGDDHAGGESEIGGIGASGAAEEMAAKSDGEHAEGDGG